MEQPVRNIIIVVITMIFGFLIFYFEWYFVGGVTLLLWLSVLYFQLEDKQQAPPF